MNRFQMILWIAPLGFVFSGQGQTVTAQGKPDMLAASDGSIAASSMVFSSPSQSFEDAAGKIVFIAGAGPNGHDLYSTIVSVIDSTRVVLAIAAGATVDHAEFRYGTDNTPLLQAAIAGLGPGGGELYIPGAAHCYALSNSILLSASNVRLYGDGDSTCLFSLYINPADGDGTRVVGISGAPLTGIEIDHLFIQNSGRTYNRANAGIALLESVNGTELTCYHVHDIHLRTANRTAFGNGGVLRNFMVDHLYIEDCGETCIYFAGAAYQGSVRENTILGSSQPGAAGPGIRVKNSTDMEVSNNFILGRGLTTAIQFPDFPSIRPVVTGNVMTGFDLPGSSGIVFAYTEDGVIRNNRIDAAKSAAIVLTYSSIGAGNPGAHRTLVEGNTVTHGSSWAISATGTAGVYASDVTVRKNLLRDNFEGLQIDNTGGTILIEDNEIATSVGAGVALSLNPAPGASCTLGQNKVSSIGKNAISPRCVLQ